MPYEIRGTDEMAGEGEFGAYEIGAYGGEGDEYGGAYEIGGAPIGHSNPKVMLEKKKKYEGRRLQIGMGIFQDGPAGPPPAAVTNFARGPSVGANGSGTEVLVCSVEPQVPFRFERVLIPSDIAGNFLIQDIKVGQASQLAGKFGVPARVFDETATNALLGVDTNAPATELSVLVLNVTFLRSTFTGSFIGVAAI